MFKTYCNRGYFIFFVPKVMYDVICYDKLRAVQGSSVKGILEDLLIIDISFIIDVVSAAGFTYI